MGRRVVLGRNAVESERERDRGKERERNCLKRIRRENGKSQRDMRTKKEETRARCVSRGAARVRS